MTERWGVTPTGPVPLIDGDRAVVSNREKCTLLKEAFFKKLGPGTPPQWDSRELT